MNILIISQYFWPENFRINELSESLFKKGNKVTVLTGMPNYPEGEIFDSYINNPKIFTNFKGVEIVRVPLFPRKKSKIFLIINYLSFCLSASTIGYFKLWKRDFDVIFVYQTSPVFVGLTSSIFSLLKKTPQVMWVLDLWPESLEAFPLFKNKLIIFFIRRLVNFIYSQCTIILCQSKSFIKAIEKQNVSPKKLIFFPAWSDTEILKKSQNFAPEIKRKKGFFNIIFSGNVGEAQDFPSIIEAFKILKKRKIKNLRLIIIGEGRMKGWVIRQIKLYKLHNLIEVYGKYPLNRMNSFFKHADALLVSLSDKKVFSMTIPGKIQSYLAAGVPIIGMINGEAANLLRKAKVGKVCEAGDYLKLANNIEELIKENKKLLNIYGDNGQKYSKRVFDKEKLISKLNRLLSRVYYKYK